MCPGRHFAKQEIMLAVAAVVVRFDMDFVEWVQSDGLPADRPAQNDKRYVGAAGIPPDLEMTILWRRRW
jgi:hypothetical protein